MRKLVSYRSMLLVGLLSVSIFSLNTFVMLPAAVVSNQPQQQLLQSAFATFPGENGLIAFSAHPDSQTVLGIYVMSSDGTGQRRINAEDGYGVLSSGPVWSPDGSKIAFSHYDANSVSNIHVMNYDGSNQIALTNYPIDSYVFNGKISWSPDGSKMAFTSIREDGQSDIYIMNAADGSQVQRLTTNTREDQYPDWSPDGSKIVFESNRDGNFELYVINADGSGETRLTRTSNEHEQLPSWSPDGSKIAFQSGNNPDIYIINADGTGRVQLTNNVGEQPVWSPQGDKIAFTKGYQEIYVMDAADGNNQVQLTDEHLLHENGPDWGSQTTLPPSEQDVSPPIITVPEDMVFEAQSIGGSVQIAFTVTARDDVDGTASLDEDNTLIQDNIGGDIAISCEPASGSMLRTAPAPHHVNCVATDAAGNSRSESFTIRVRPPELAQPVLSITEKDCSRYPESIYYRYVVEGLPRDVSDYVIFTLTTGDGTETVVEKFWSRGIGEVGSTGGAFWGPPGGLSPYTLTYYEATGPDNPEDATAANIVPLPGGLRASTTFTCEPVQEDTTPPFITVPENIVEEATTANGGTVVSYNVTAEDNVDGTATLEEDGTTITQDGIGGNLTISCEPPSGSEFPIGDTEVQCTATDEAGNEGTASFTVTVNPPPPVPDPLTVEINSNATDDVVPATFEFEANVTGGIEPYTYNWDFGDGSSQVSNEQTVVHTYEEAGQYTVTLTVTDTSAQQQQATDTLEITVNEPQPPPVEDTTPPILTVPEDITAQATTANGGTVVTYSVSAEDNIDGTATLEEDASLTQDDVGGNIAILCDPPSGTEFPVGDTVVECTATDAAGNTETASFTVTVNPPQQPPPTPTTPREAIEQLISYIENLEGGIPEGAKTGIVTTLERVLVLLSDNNTRNDASACNIIGGFMNQVNAHERRGSLTEDQADDLRTQAADIRDMSDCG